ncbi:plasmid pRiA4b ORF-3 family protein [Sinorhizobium meliloti]|nr:plasmid pRiA4b ORF-3 family protein [Sinorhizobium meliloti]MDW9911562.1 plasmid pRiA4b ORF-3 family protein [Sinorhizobium meliloti]MDW9973738.1 plasmid pRiA4b ORF-3 family protein [Sinorhizobium meliloti]MDW9978348.1 plasmid pRiA4b ORF-3 family protein [Sinorhizobium meliloti]MDX0296022.1 plasmid pRiA4b ORF-3 family protein [Sinorhizobium meliloti]
MPAKLVRGMICGMLDPFDPDRFIVRAEVHILGIEPKISRTVELPITLNLAQLHEVLQAAFGWTDSHLHQFNIGGLIYGAPEFDEDGLSDSRTFEATEVRMIDLQFPYEENPLTILYEYDFGEYPRCLAGKRSGPPEDVGGTSGYADFIDAWLDPDHEEHKAMRRWVGRKFHPEACNLDEINKAIGKALRASKGDYRFRRESHRD